MMNKFSCGFILLPVLLLFFSGARAQHGADYPVKRPHDWWQSDLKKDSLPGISLEEAYNYLQGKKSKSVIVAELDDCIDTSHEDLKNILWVNKNEVPGNNMDDDHNGYVDDVNGWCFVCGKNNTSQTQELSDAARTYITWRGKFEHADTSKMERSLKIQYDMYIQSKKLLSEIYNWMNPC